MKNSKKRHHNFVDHTGECFKNNEGENLTIVKYEGTNKCSIKFDDGNTLDNKSYKNIKRGRVKNPYKKRFYNVGYFGYGKYDTNSKNIYKIAYSVWLKIIQRCYSKSNKTYEGVKVCKEWHNYQNFADWFEKNYTEGWHIDKDILVKGNKIYSPKNCCFVPKTINNLFTNRRNHRNGLPIGVSKDGNLYRATSTQNKKQVYFGSYKTPEEAFKAYKKGKEKYIKEVADRWKGEISEDVYKAMYKWNIEITD